MLFPGWSAIRHYECGTCVWWNEPFTYMYIKNRWRIESPNYRFSFSHESRQSRREDLLNKSALNYFHWTGAFLT
jgi:hypothetical protein